MNSVLESEQETEVDLLLLPLLGKCYLLTPVEVNVCTNKLQAVVIIIIIYLQVCLSVGYNDSSTLVHRAECKFEQFRLTARQLFRRTAIISGQFLFRRLGDV
jgi:hypothetical protein